MNSLLTRRLLFSGMRGVPMTRLTIVGIAVAVATLVVTLAIIDGFAESYQEALVGFQSPLLIVREDESIDREAVESVLAEMQPRSAETSSADISSLQWATRARDFWWWGVWQYGQLSWQASSWPVVGPLVQQLNPRAFVDEHALPVAIAARRDAWHARLREQGRRGVTAAHPFLYREGLLVGAQGVRGVALRGVPPAAIGTTSHMVITRTDATAALATVLDYTPGQPLPVLIGQALARDIGTTGLALQIPTPGQDELTTVPLKIVGTFAAGVYEFDMQFLFVDLAALQSIYGVLDRITGFEIQVDHLAKTPWMVDHLAERLGPTYDIRDWRETHRATFEAIKVEKLLFALVMGLLVIVAVVNIISAMVLRILARHRTLALLQALGMTVRGLRRMTFWQGMAIGAISIAIGIGGGWLLAWVLGAFGWLSIPPEVYFLTHVPTQVRGTTLCGITVFALLVVAWSARRAARRVTALPMLTLLGRGYL